MFLRSDLYLVEMKLARVGLRSCTSAFSTGPMSAEYLDAKLRAAFLCRELSPSVFAHVTPKHDDTEDGDAVAFAIVNEVSTHQSTWTIMGFDLTLS